VYAPEANWLIVRDQAGSGLMAPFPLAGVSNTTDASMTLVRFSPP